MFCLQRLIFEIREVFKFQKICPFAAHFYCTKKKHLKGCLLLDGLLLKMSCVDNKNHPVICSGSGFSRLVCASAVSCWREGFAQRAPRKVNNNFHLGTVTSTSTQRSGHSWASLFPSAFRQHEAVSPVKLLRKFRSVCSLLSEKDHAFP